MNKRTRKALTEIPTELRKLSKIIAIIGENLIDAKIRKTREYGELLEKEQAKEEKRPGKI